MLTVTVLLGKISLASRLQVAPVSSFQQKPKSIKEAAFHELKQAVNISVKNP